VKALVAQGGGPTAVINQSLAGVVLEARRFNNIESVYGACHGIAGISPEIGSYAADYKLTALTEVAGKLPRSDPV
jgi:6-phosphofructokinase